MFSSVHESDRRRTIGKYAMLLSAALFLATVGVTTAFVSQASALPGRRLCMYVNGEYHNGVWKWMVVNYKKGGGCPRIKADNHFSIVTQTNGVPKRTCEEVSEFVGYGDDVCRILKEDELYELDFDQPTCNFTYYDEGPIRKYS